MHKNFQKFWENYERQNFWLRKLSKFFRHNLWQTKTFQGESSKFIFPTKLSALIFDASKSTQFSQLLFIEIFYKVLLRNLASNYAINSMKWKLSKSKNFE